MHKAVHSFFDYYHSGGVISVPTGRFVLTLRFRTVKTICCCRYAFAQKTSASLQGFGPTRCWSRRRYHRTWCF